MAHKFSAKREIHMDTMRHRPLWEEGQISKMSSKCWREGACGPSFRVPTPGGHSAVHINIQGHRLPYHGTYRPEGNGYPSLGEGTVVCSEL